MPLNCWNNSGSQPIRFCEPCQRATASSWGIVAAVSHRPRLLILDEPTAGLDPLVRIDILRFLRTSTEEGGTGVVLSSHVSDDLDRIADSVLMLDKGTVLEYAPRKVLLDRFNESQLEAVFLNAVGRISTPGVPHRA